MSPAAPGWQLPAACRWCPPPAPDTRLAARQITVGALPYTQAQHCPAAQVKHRQLTVHADGSTTHQRPPVSHTGLIDADARHYPCSPAPHRPRPPADPASARSVGPGSYPDSAPTNAQRLALGRPVSSSRNATCRCRLLGSTTSSSTSTSSPTPAPARYKPAGLASPPQPTTNTRAAARASCPARSNSPPSTGGCSEVADRR